MIRLFALLAVLLLCRGAAGAAAPTQGPRDAQPSPLTVVSESVHVSIGPEMALIVGRHWLQYVPRKDDVTPRIAVHYPAFVPKGVTAHDELLELTQVKMMVGETEYRPESSRILDAAELGAIQVAPEDAAVAWFTFQIPRRVARHRFDVVISRFQPHYHREGKTVAAYWPWLPDLEALRLELELKDSDYILTFEGLPGTEIELLSTPSVVVKQTATLLTVRPRHLENIAVAVKPAAAAP